MKVNHSEGNAVARGHHPILYVSVAMINDSVTVCVVTFQYRCLTWR